MSERTMLIDIDRCMRCYACEVACKQENELPAGPRWCRVVTIEPRKIKDQLHMDFVPTMCAQCQEPICSQSCPVNAIRKRADGIVLVDEGRCTGCKLCVYSCPYGAMQFNQEKDKAGKCNLCANRIDSGLEPSCVQHCIGGALQL